jgi:4-hydroxybenzoate polyprenyltransferase
VERVFATPGISFADCARALRLHQWSKNLLLLIPVVSAHQWTKSSCLWDVILGLAAFSLCASSVYLLNDLLDLEADRHHHSKRHRPLASGKIPLVAGLAAAPVLLALSAAIACCLGWKFAAIFAVYYLTTLLYSLRFKQIELLDVMTLAGLYIVRILAGGIAADVPVSDWLITFSLFFFMSLAFAKRFTEIHVLRNATEKIKGRGYTGNDMELVSSMGVGSGYLSVLVLAMYVSHPSVTSLYSRPEILWVVCPLLLYWVSRVWLLAHRGTLHEDPILFALRDGQSWIVVILLGIIGFAAGPK